MSTAELWDCPIEDYHRDGRESVSHSELKAFRDDPALYYERYITGMYPQKRKHEFDFGNVFHWITLGEPFEIDSDNFREHTVATFHRDTPPDIVPNFVSDSGSEYWYTENGMYRRSDHWGIVGRNYWALRDSAHIVNPVTGSCRWDRFLFQEHFVPIPPEVLGKVNGKVSANGARSTNAYKDFAAEHAGEMLLKEADFHALAEMLNSIREHEWGARMLEADGQTEVGMKWVDEETGITCRCRPDKLMARLSTDLKSYAGNPLNSRKLANHIEDMGYHTQAAWYQDGIEAVTGERLPFVFMFVGKNPPYTCRTVDLEQEWIDEAREINRVALGELAECKASGEWRAKDHGKIVTIPRPTWTRSDRYEFSGSEA